MSVNASRYNRLHLGRYYILTACTRTFISVLFRCISLTLAYLVHLFPSDSDQGKDTRCITGKRNSSRVFTDVMLFLNNNRLQLEY